jgi:hypothetical protein
MDSPADYPALATQIARTRESALELAEAVRRSRELREEARRLREWWKGHRPAPLKGDKSPLH